MERWNSTSAAPVAVVTTPIGFRELATGTIEAGDAIIEMLARTEVAPSASTQ